MTTESRMQAIENYGKKRVEDKQLQRERLSIELERNKEKIKALEPRMKELFRIANACEKNELNISPFYEKYGDSYSTSSLMFGKIAIKEPATIASRFLKTKIKPSNTIRYLSLAGVHVNLITNGEDVYENYKTGSEPDFRLSELIRLTEQFLKEFDQFESDFYTYVDNYTKMSDMEERDDF